MIFENLCGPAALNLAFSLVQIIIDISKQMYNTALVKFFISIIYTIILNILCEKGFEIISWIVVFLPFIFMTVITTILLFVFGLNPSSGKYNYSIKIPRDNGEPINQYTDDIENRYRHNSEKHHRHDSEKHHRHDSEKHDRDDFDNYRNDFDNYRNDFDNYRNDFDNYY